MIARAMCWMIVMAMCAASSNGAYAATGAQVDEAIKKAKAYLLASMNGDNWEEVPKRAEGDPYDVKAGQWGGMSSLAAYALLASGENPQHTPKLAAGVKFLRNADINGIYALGMRMQVWLLLGASKDNQAAMKRDAVEVMNSVKLEGGSKGFYNYLARDKDDRYDHSVSQYAVLGMWAAEQFGAEVPAAYWKLMEEAWRKDQAEDGGWGYEGKVEPKPSMTAAGLASLFIFQDVLHGHEFVDCKGNFRDEAMEKGLRWMSKHAEEINKGDWPFYTLYGVERVGVAAGYKYFGTVDWYKQGSEWLLTTQEAEGNFGGGDRMNKITNTCFGLLFLIRGRAPVMMNKLEYAIDYGGDKGKPTHWNNRPRDAAHLAGWVTKQFERYINWQIVNLNVEPEDWLDAPILYMTGNQPLNLKAEDVAKLKRFVDAGGLILANADCSQRAFSDTFERMGEKMFPGLKFREIPADHLIMSQPHSSKTWRTKPTPRGLSNGARELMIVFPTGDPARLWQTGTHGGPAVSWSEIAENIYVYAANKAELRSKEDSYFVKADANVHADKSIKVARLMYGKDNVADPEPGGWRRLAAISHNVNKIDLEIVPITLGQGKLTPDIKVAHLTGARKFELSAPGFDELKKWVNAGGTLIVDACGGSTDFANAAEVQIGAMAPGAKAPFPIMPPDHAVFSATGQPAVIDYRPYARKTLLSTLREPRLRGLQVNNRLAIYFSNEDLSVGLVGNGVDGVLGYSPKSAASLMLGMIYSGAGAAIAPVKP